MNIPLHAPCRARHNGLGPARDVSMTKAADWRVIAASTCIQGSVFLIHLRLQYCRADRRTGAGAAAHRQIERRTDLGIGRNRGELRRKHIRIARRPYEDRAVFAQIVEIDPGRASRLAVDQPRGWLGE